MLGELRTFLLRGNVLELAVGIVIGAAFTGVVTSFVNDLLMPPIGLGLGGRNFADLFVSLNGVPYPSLAAAKAAGAPTLNYGVFLNTVLNFVIDDKDGRERPRHRSTIPHGPPPCHRAQPR